MAATPVKAHIILFEDENLLWNHIHVFEEADDLTQYKIGVGGSGNFNDLTSSFVVLQGTWRFFLDINLSGLIGSNSGYDVGVYPFLPDGIPNDSISSLTPN